MPGDVTGSLVYDARTAEFSFRAGPVFTNLLLADEINRTPPKTQASLLEAMEERQVSVDGTPRPLPDPFLVIATQNPVEYEGTYPLPEAQLDRFLLKLLLPLPERDDEIEVLARHAAGFDPRDLAGAGVRPVAGADDARPRPGRGGARPGRARGARLRRRRLPRDPARRRRSRSASRRAARPRCSRRRARGRGCPAAATSRPTTSRRSRTRRCGTASSCAPRPSSRASPPRACSTRCSPPCPSPAEPWPSRGARPSSPRSASRWCSSCPRTGTVLLWALLVVVACVGRRRARRVAAAGRACGGDVPASVRLARAGDRRRSTLSPTLGRRRLRARRARRVAAVGGGRARPARASTSRPGDGTPGAHGPACPTRRGDAHADRVTSAASGRSALAGRQASLDGARAAARAARVRVAPAPAQPARPAARARRARGRAGARRRARSSTRCAST